MYKDLTVYYDYWLRMFLFLSDYSDFDYVLELQYELLYDDYFSLMWIYDGAMMDMYGQRPWHLYKATCICMIKIC